MSLEEFDENQTIATRPNESALATPAALPMSEIQLRIAHEHPRNELEVGKRLSQELTDHADFADSGFYSIPYKNNREGLIHFVEGVSIRAAEHMWTRWGNCTIAARVADDRGSKIMVQGMFFDYETGLLNLADLEVSKTGKARRGGTYPLGEKELRLAVASAQSKVKRNAFLGGIPVWIKDGYLTKCYQLVLGPSKKPMADRIEAAKSFFTSRFSVSIPDVEKLIAKVRAVEIVSDENLLRYLIGLKNALIEGNAELDFVFGEERQPLTMPQEKKPDPDARSGDAPGDAQEPA